MGESAAPLRLLAAAMANKFPKRAKKTPMATRSVPLTALSEMVPGQEADVFVLLTAKEQLNTREGKPYFRVAFRDRGREVSFPIWDNSPLAADCRDHWSPGVFYKVRAAYRETNYGPQLDIRKIREVVAADADDGFDPAMCLPQSRFEPRQMFDQLLAIAREEIADGGLRALVESILLDNREALLRIPAARHNHHAFVAGWLEHTLERDADLRLSGGEIRRVCIPRWTRRWTAAWSSPAASCTTSASSASWTSGRRGRSTRPRAG